jgi:hypothetical protein
LQDALNVLQEIESNIKESLEVGTMDFDDALFNLDLLSSFPIHPLILKAYPSIIVTLKKV